MKLYSPTHRSWRGYPHSERKEFKKRYGKKASQKKFALRFVIWFTILTLLLFLLTRFTENQFCFIGLVITFFIAMSVDAYWYSTKDYGEFIESLHKVEPNTKMKVIKSKFFSNGKYYESMALGKFKGYDLYMGSSYNAFSAPFECIIGEGVRKKHNPVENPSDNESDVEINDTLKYRVLQIKEDKPVLDYGEYSFSERFIIEGGSPSDLPEEFKSKILKSLSDINLEIYDNNTVRFFTDKDTYIYPFYTNEGIVLFWLFLVELHEHLLNS